MTLMSSRILLGGLLAFGVASASHAQGTYGPQNWGSTYNAPNWGQNGATPWGTQSGGVGQNGWQYSGTPQANQPAGNSAYPNLTNRPFGSPSDTYNPLTSRGRRF